MIILLLLYMIGIGESRGRHHPLTKPTSIPCDTTEDCLEHYAHAWCKSGMVCVRNQCHTIPSYPCNKEDACIESSRECRKRNCSSWRDCDDGIFCNGVEICVASFCEVDHQYDCTHGMCVEERAECITPLSLQSVSLKTTTFYIMDTPSANSTMAPTTNTTGLDSTQTIWITVIVVACIIFGAGVVVFLLSSMKGGSGTEPYVFVIEKNYDDDAGPDADPTSGYTHELHYQ
jgi:hypothetical protein